MSKKVLSIHRNNLHFQVKVSDCWTINGKPVRFIAQKIDEPDHPDFTGFRIVILWFAIWLVWRVSK